MRTQQIPLNFLAALALLFLVFGWALPADALGGPEACFDITVQNCFLTVCFDASCSSGAETYIWLFGDGTGGSGLTICHTYQAEGDYQVTLIVSNTRLIGPGTVTDRTVQTAHPTNCLASSLGSQPEPATLEWAVATGEAASPVEAKPSDR